MDEKAVFTSSKEDIIITSLFLCGLDSLDDISRIELDPNKSMLRSDCGEGTADVVDCIGRSLIGVGVSGWGFAGKITEKVAYQIIKQAARKALGPIGAIWTVIDFMDCMGVIDVWGDTGEDGNNDPDDDDCNNPDDDYNTQMMMQQ